MNLSNTENMQELFRKHVPKASQGDQDAISALYEATYNQIYHTVKSMVQDEDAILDIVQDSYVKAFQSLNQLDTPEHFRAWLKQIATNKTKDFFKKKRPILFSEMVSEDGEEIDFQDDRTENLPEEVIDRQETARLISEILGSLSEEQHLVIGMFYYEQMSVREIAELLDCSENTVKSRLNYGRKKVEVQVRELEKKGTKLYSLAPIPFLLWLFHMDAQAASLPAAVPPVDSLLSVLQSSPVPSAGSRKIPNPTGKAATAGSGKAAAAKAATTGGKALALKITAGVLAAAVVTGGIAMAISSSHSGNHSSKSDPTIVTLDSPCDQTYPADMTLKQIAENAPTAYELVKSEYLRAMSADSETYLAAPENYICNGCKSLSKYHTEQTDNFYTALLDINKDGVDELLIGFGQPETVQLVDMYGFNGIDVYQLWNDPDLADSSEMYLMENGVLCHTKTVTETQHDISFWEMINGVFHNVSLSEADPVQPDWSVLGQEREPEVTEETTVETTEETTKDSSYEQACQELLELYLSAIHMDDDQWNNDPDIYERFPNMGDTMYYYHSGAFADPHWFYALSDINEDGIDELFIGFAEGADDLFTCEVYVWNGTEMEILKNCQILQDGTILQYAPGNGGELISVKQLEGSTLVDKTGTGLEQGADKEAINQHGGFFVPEWKKLTE